MASYDVALAAVLDDILPRDEAPGDWARVVADAAPDASTSSTPSASEALRRAPRGRRGFVIALAALVIAVIAPLAALAVTEGWWFFASGAPTPVSGVVVVTTGSWGGVPWTLSAYRSDTNGVCYALTPRGQENQRGLGAAMACDAIAGVPVSFRVATPDHTISYLLGRGGDLPTYIAGPVVPTASSVEVVLNGNRHIRVAPVAAPASLGTPIDFYVARLPKGVEVRALLARSARGRIVGYMPVIANAAVPVGELGHFSNRGKLLVLPPRLKHALRAAHRSTVIHLLATRDGRNYYRLGGADISRGGPHICFGVGPAIPLSSVPPTRRGLGRLVGIIMCSPRTPTSFPSRTRPVWDLSVYGADRKHPQMHLLRLEGFASDAVKKVLLLNAHNQPMMRVPVIGNVYSLRHVPDGVVAIAPSDIGGRPLAICGPGAGAITSGSYLQAHC